ncbi:MAG TPA: NAD(P)H-dependent oxidoreductase subunit E [Fimbriimonadaceae bacterium]|nr:NAD(P)H-dependent oxidoreductase subunit E [Fimbriimonadaceae bacterium]
MSELLRVGSIESGASRRPGPPKAEDLTLRFSQKAISELEALKTHYPEDKACILPCLWIAQREYGGFLDGEAIAEVAYRLKRSYAEIEGVATFYSMYNTEHNPGTHKIEVCTCLTCHLCGAYRIFDYLKQKLGVDNKETTPDGMFMLEEVECLDACDRAPLLQVGDEYIGPVDEAAIDALLARLRSQSQPTVTKLADEIVQVHLRDTEQKDIAGA